MRINIKIGVICFFLLTLVQAGKANSVLNPFTKEIVSVDSILSNMLKFAPSYGRIVNEYNANLYIKGELHVVKKNALFRYLPVMFRVQKGVRDYLTESYSELHYTAPNIYDHKVKGSIGTASGGRRFEGLMLEYFRVNVYSSSLLFDKLLSPLSSNGQKYYTYQVDTVMGTPLDTQYKVWFTPRTKSDQLVEGYMIVSANVWSVREMRFSGRSELLAFDNMIRMGEVGENDEFLPVRYEFNERFSFVGNVVDGSYTADLDYKSITLDPKQERRRRRKHTHDLSDSYTLTTDTNAYRTDIAYFEQVRPINLTEDERKMYQDYAYRKDTIRFNPPKKSRVFWGQVGDILLTDYNLNFANAGTVRCSPLFNPFLLSYSGSNGLSYRQSFKYNRLFSGDHLLRVVPRLGYNFTQKELYWSLGVDYGYWPEKIGTFHLAVGNGNRIYSSDVLDEIKEMPDSVFDFNQIQMEYFHDLYCNLSHSIELVNGLELNVGVSMHKRTPVKKNTLLPIKPGISLTPDLNGLIKDEYISFAPRIRVEYTPGLYYYMNGRRKVNLRSEFPTFAVDWERGIKGVFGSTGKYERVEFDLQHQLPLGLMRNIYYRFGLGAFTNQEELYFVDFVNFARNNLPVGWNDEIGGVFQLLDRRWYNSSNKYVRGHFTYEAPFLFLRHLNKYTRYVENERLYISALAVPHLQPYLELGYGIGTHAFDFGVFIGSENLKYTQVGCKFTFELFNR